MDKRVLSRVAILVSCSVIVPMGALRLHSGRRNNRNENGINGCAKQGVKKMKNHNRANMTQIGAGRLFHSQWSAWRIGMLFLFPLLVMMHHAHGATVDPGNITFDHSRTGFTLTGSHILARCSSCHVDGVFKGTPRDCTSCHVAGNRMGAAAKNTMHIPTFDKCEKCHQTNAWTPAKKFDHLGVAPGSCQTCHNGTKTMGKPSWHIATTDSCDSCHKTADWKQLGAGGLLPANHLPTTQACSLCHNQASFIPGVMNHTGILVGCANCHNGQVFTGVAPKSKPTGSTPHVPSNMPCEVCHSVSKFTSFLIPTSPTMMNHAGIITGCVTCHNGQSFYGVGIPKNKTSFTGHISTSLDCSACHPLTTTFSMANLTTLPIGHLPTTQPCSTCHAGNVFTPGSGVMMHTGILGGCASCHNGQVFTGVAPKSKPVNHLPSSLPCETCHSKSNFTTFSGTLMKHTGIVSGCTNCHNGQTFAGGTSPVSKPTGSQPHLPTNMSCETCHSTSKTTSGGFGPNTPMIHTGIFSGCATCHGFVGAPKTFAVGKTPKPQTISATHTSAGMTPCESCHTSTSSFTVATGGSKPSNHLPTTQPCSLCHNGASYYPGVMNHTGISSGCTTCHNGQVFAGVTPVSKPVNHLPTNRPCETCHTTSNTSPGGFSGGTMNHTGIVSGCANCHNGQAFAGVAPKSKSTNHIPYAMYLLGGASMSCEFCHSRTVFTSFTTGLVSSTTMHNGSLGKGSGQCTGCHLNTGTAYIGVRGRKSLTHEKSGHTDCSDSGCHRPLGNEGNTYTSW